MDEHDPTLCREFVRQAKQLFAAHPDIKHVWSISADEDQCFLDIQKSDDDGFDITVEVDLGEIEVWAYGYRSLFDGNDPQAVVGPSMELIRDLLSPHLRIKEYLAGGSPYRWDVERFVDGNWTRISVRRLTFWNYAGKRSQKFYQNQRLSKEHGQSP